VPLRLLKKMEKNGDEKNGDGGEWRLHKGKTSVYALMPAKAGIQFHIKYSGFRLSPE
jgi:hypothetical protein